MPIIFESDTGNVLVEHDPGTNNGGEVVGINVYYDAENDDPDCAERWLSEEESAKLVGALSAALGVQVEVGPRASITGADLNADLIRVAIAHDEAILFRYAKGSDGSVIETRSLRPSEIKTVGDHETVIGFDPDRDDVRAYRLDRIKGNIAVVA